MRSPRASRPSLLLAFLAAAASSAAAQFDYAVEVDVDERRWMVEGRFANPGGEPFEFWIARWTPGAYHLADFGRFAGPLTAYDDEGEKLAVERLSDSHWRIDADGAERVVVRYPADSLSTSVYSNGVLDVESNRIADDYAYVTPVSLFGFVPGRLDEPFSLHVEAPEEWRIATVLERDDSGAFLAPSYYRFEDSPLLMSPTLRTVETRAAGKPLFVTVHGESGSEMDEIVEGCRDIVEAAAGLMREEPPYERYHFLLGFVPEGQGSGLEHSDSTLILVPSFAPIDLLWGIVAHEYFHLWCAERIHVEAIRDPDYTKPLVTGTIWVNESITEYMTQHVLLHAGMKERDELLLELAARNPMLEAMAKSLGPATEVSRAAVGWEGMQDLMTFAAKMYFHGPRVMFALDMEMRRASDGERGIVDLLVHLDDEYAEKGRGFPEDGMLEILEEVAGSDLGAFYEAYVEGAGDPDPAAALEVIGYRFDGDEIEESPVASPSQLEAREDWFSIDG